MALLGLCLELSFSVLYCRTQANLPTLINFNVGDQLGRKPGVVPGLVEGTSKGRLCSLRAYVFGNCKLQPGA